MIERPGASSASAKRRRRAGSGARSARSDASGHFAFEQQLPAGDYELRCVDEAQAFRAHRPELALRVPLASDTIAVPVGPTYSIDLALPAGTRREDFARKWVMNSVIPNIRRWRIVIGFPPNEKSSKSRKL